MTKVTYFKYFVTLAIVAHTDYGLPERKYPSLHGRKFNPNPKFLGTSEAYFVCHIDPIFQISLIYAFIGCLRSMHPIILYFLRYALPGNLLH